MKKVLKVPVVLQMEALECGAACLAMILAYHKKFIPLEQLRTDCGVSRDGSNAKNITLAAKSYGLNVKALKLETEDLRDIPLPAIIHWNFNHFVVLNGFKKHTVSLNDPAFGIIEVSYEEFNLSFTGVVLTFEKTEKFVSGGAKASPFLYLKNQLSGQLIAFALLLMLGAVIGLTNTMPAVYFKIFIDNIIFKLNEAWLVPLLIAMLITLLLNGVAVALKQRLLVKIKSKLGIVFSAKYMWHVLRLPVDFFSARFSSDIAKRQSDNDLIVSVLCENIVPVFLNFAMMIFYMTVMFKINILMTLTGITAACLNLILLSFISKKRINLMRLLKNDEGKLIGATTSAIELVETIKSSGNELNAFAKWAGCYALKNNNNVEYIKSVHSTGEMPRFLSGVLNLIILSMGIYLILLGNITIGTFISFQGLMVLLVTPVEDIFDSASKTQEVYGRIERINDVINYPIDSRYDIENQIDMADINDIELRGITFGYSPLSEPVVKNISFKIKKGEIISIVGSSGSGKSTVYKLIAGLYKAWSGEILFNEVEISKIPHDALTDSLAIVHQDCLMFSGTIWDNITLWDTSINQTDVLNAAKDADIHDFIMEREGGYSSKVLEEGKNFSGGQRQRFEIARALAKNPSILILDEATSALDTKSEQKIMEAVKRRGIMCIVISHRLSIVRNSHEILVLDMGEISERGTNDKLMKKDGTYAKLIKFENR